MRVRSRGGLSTALLLSSFALAGGALAEVRLRGAQGDAGQLVVQVVPGPLGLWSPRGPVDDRVLNARGDLLGDSTPGLSQGRPGALAAWLRHSTGELCLARATPGVGWGEISTVPAPGAVGVPLVQAAHDGWVVAWQAGPNAESPARVMAMYVTEGEQGIPVPVAQGSLVRAWAGGSSASLLVLATAGADEAELLVFSAIEPPFEPIDWSRGRLVDRVRLGDFPGVESTSDLAALLASWSLYSTPLVRGHERRALAWVSGQATIKALELDADTGEPLAWTTRQLDEPVDALRVGQLLSKAVRSIGR